MEMLEIFALIVSLIASFIGIIAGLYSFIFWLISYVKKTKFLPSDGKYEWSHLPPPIKPTRDILLGRAENLDTLDKALNTYGCDVVWIHAVGGAGKSTLLYHWLSDLRNEKYKGLEKAFAWSFNNQDGQQYQTSSSDFLNLALGHFGIKASEIGSLKDDETKAKLLVQRLQQQPSLLVLDGVETLQYPEGSKSFNDKLQDMAVKAFLESVYRNGLAKTPSLIIVTSRLPLQEFEDWDKSRYEIMSLGNLSDKDGMKLLEKLQLKDTHKKIEDKYQGEIVSAQLYGHALSLVLLGNLVKSELDGYLGLWNNYKLPHLWKRKEFKEQIQPMLDFYVERWGKKKQPEAIFMHLLGLFDHPMQKNEFNILKDKSAYTKPLRNLDKAQENKLFQHLETVGLLLPNLHSKRTEWDTHPIIRAYFSEHFKKTQPQFYKEIRTLLDHHEYTPPPLIREYLQIFINYFKSSKPKRFLAEGFYDLSRLPLPVNTSLFGRTENLAALTRALNKDGRDIVWVHAVGGAGKSALLYRWLDGLRKKQYGDLEKVFAWSFNSQQHQVSSSDFLIQALEHFGEKKIPKDDVVKAQLLAQRLQQQPSLLVLDGVENLQYPESLKSFNGELQDMAMKAFLQSVHHNSLVQSPSLIIFTSRLPLQEFKDWDDSRYVAMSLESLSDSDGMKLLNALGAKDVRQKIQWKNPQGKWIERQQGEAVSTDLHGHALSLVLLGNLVKTELDGRLELRDQLPHLWEAEGSREKTLGMLDFYIARWGDKSPESIFMQLLGLFDRAMQVKELSYLWLHLDYIKPLKKLSVDKREQIILDLEHVGLLLPNVKRGTDQDEWDTHPLIRSYFGQIFKELGLAEYIQAHNLLFEYYQSVPDKYQPDTLEGLDPLYHAIKHGCLVGQYRKALNIYYERILQGSNENYSFNKLGTYNQDLVAVSSFFPQGWLQPVQKGLSESAQAFLLSQASFYLMSLGRLNETLEPRKASLKLSEKLEDWVNSSAATQNLVDLFILLGNLAQATEHAKLAISYAQKSGDDFEQLSSHAYLAHCLHQQGQLAEALQHFQQVEQLEQKRGDKYLYSNRGFYYCALLLDQATVDIEHVLERGEYSLSIVKNLLSIALDKLTLARCYQALKSEQATTYFDEAVAAIRKAGTIQELPLFLIDRANLHLQQQNLALAKTDLEEAHDIIQRSKMKLYETDYHLAMCRYELQKGNKNQAIEHRNQAKKLIDETGYHLRDKDLESLNQDLQD